MDIPLSVLADSANISVEGKINIFGIFSNINAYNFPTQHPQMQLVLAFETDNAEAGKDKQVEIQLVDDDGKKLFSIAGIFKVPEGKSGHAIRINHIVPLIGVTFPNPGDYAFKILVNGDTKKSVHFSVSQATLPKPKKGKSR